ncbi:hypothetical protein [Bradyrhizobium sp.]|jgi:hypothetical protein|uniref:hypothetical protein n=1 Tax=Bradyrhizobium sp. TaxID=376 RepID=UPI003BAE8C94
MRVNGEVILENVRRYRAIASLYRQTATFRPHQRCSLLDQADEWEHLAVVELEAYFKLCDSPACNLPPGVTQHANTRWKMVAAA